MKNIIFLDIDGVLNNNKDTFLLESVDVLKQLIKIYNAKIVMITSWQGNGNENKRNFIRNKLELMGIYDIDFIDPNFKGSFCDINLPSRLLGIVHYLKEFPSSNYVILDDEYYNDYKLICLNHYKTMMYKGLAYSDLSKIEFKSVNLNNLKHVDYEYRLLGEYEKAVNNLIKVLKMKCENDIKSR